MPEPLTASQQDALSLDLLGSMLNELNLYSHECSTLALMSEAMAQHRAPTVATLPAEPSAESVAAVRAGLQWEVEQHERRLSELRQRLELLDVQL